MMEYINGWKRYYQRIQFPSLANTFILLAQVIMVVSVTLFILVGINWAVHKIIGLIL